MSINLSIILVCYNKWNFTKLCLNDLSKLPEDNEIILIDNASTDETNKEIKLLNSKINYIKNDENIFHSKACNQGAKIATGENILFLNNDIRVRSNHDNWTENLIEACQNTNGLVGPTMGLLDKDLNFVKEVNQQLTGNSYLSGWCVAAKREVWDKIKINNTDQIWSEDLPFYFNDGDLSFRARQKKISLNVISLPDIVHFGKVSAAQINVHKLYNEGRNIFIKKWKNK